MLKMTLFYIFKKQKHVWSNIKIRKRIIFNHEDYVFYNQMTIDGFSCSLLFFIKKQRIW